MRTLRPILVTTSLALSALAALPAVPAQAQGTPQKGGTVIFALAADPPTLNPDVTSGIPDQLVGCILYQGLTRVDGNGDIKPMLAKSWTISPDGKTYTFDLEKANWQDGKPLTSEDVKYTLGEISAKYSPLYAGAQRMTEGIDTPAPDKLVIRLKDSYGPLLLSLACVQGTAILPKHVYEGTNPLQNPATLTTPVGMGPFLLAEWKHNDYLRLSRNPNYREPGKPYLDEVVAKVIPQASSRTQALQAGEVDFVPYFFLAASDYASVRANPKLDLTVAHVPPGTDFLQFNVNRKPLDDKRVRQALMMATDRDYLLKTVFQGMGSAAVMPFTSQIKWAANPDVNYNKMYPFDVTKANALLDETGLKKGADGTRAKITLMYSSDGQELALVAAALKAMWRNVGFDVAIEAADRPIALKRIYETRDVDASLASLTTYGDPAIGIARNFVSSAIGKVFSNGSGYSNPAIDDLFTQGEKATGLTDRGAFYKKAQAILAVDLPIMTLHERALFAGQTRTLKGIDDENFTITWANAWREK